MTLQSLDANAVKRLLDDGTAVLVDIREPQEHSQERIPGAILAPLSALPAHRFDPADHRALVFHCKGGTRTATNAALLAQKASGQAYVLSGGIEGWKAAGLPVER